MTGGGPTLVTVRLALRPWRPGDEDAVFGYIDDAFSTFLPLPRPYARADAGAFVAGNIATDWALHPRFALTLASAPIGDVNLRVDATHSTAEVGWGIASAYWGRGYATEAGRAAIAWALAEYGLAKAIAVADRENVASWRVMEKLGMTREGVFRSHRLLRGERRDMVQYGVLADEFRG